MRLIDLIFCDEQSDHELFQALETVACGCADLQFWDELADRERIFLFAKLLNTRQAIEHCMRVNFKANPDKLPKFLDDIEGADDLAPWNVPRCPEWTDVSLTDWLAVQGFSQ